MLNLKQQQQLTEEIRQYFFASSKLQDPPALLKHLLESAEMPVCQLQHLYEPLRAASSIVIRPKLDKLLDCMDKLTRQPALSLLLDQIGTAEESDGLQLVQRTLRFPRMLANYRPPASAGGVQLKLVDRLSQLSSPVQAQAISMLLILGEAELLLGSSCAIEIAASSLLRLKKGYSLVQAALRQRNSETVDQLTRHLSEEELSKLFLDHVLFVETLLPSTAALLSELFRKRLSPKGLGCIFRKVLFQWSNTSFPKTRSPNSQKMLSNLISLLMGAVDLAEGEVILAVNQGITCRFEYFKEEEFVCQSAVVVMKAYARALKLGDSQDNSFSLQDISQLYPLDIFVDDTQPDVSALQPQATLPHTSDDATQKAASPNGTREEGTEEEGVLFRPRNLYDCYLGLLSEQLLRKRLCLKALEPLIRQQCSDLVFVWHNLVSVLVTLKDSNESIAGFQSLRSRALGSLIIYRPVDVIQFISDHFYRDCALADRLFLMDTIATAVRELSDNPAKYEGLEREQQPEDAFYFTKLTSRYTKPIASQTRASKEQERTARVETQSRRWGHTRIIHSRSQQTGDLKAMSRQELMVVGEPYLNRLYTIVDQLFFRFVLPLRNRPKQLKDVLFSCAILQLLSEFAHHLKNYGSKYKIIEEMLDLHELVTVKDIAVERKKLSLLLKISTVVDSNLSRYELVLDKLLGIVRSYQSSVWLNVDDKYPWFDPSLKMLLQLLTENIRKVMTTFSMPQSWAVQ